MRKFLLSLAVLAAWGLTSSAETYQYGYAGDDLEGVGTSVAGTNYSAVIKVPAEVAAQMKGSKVTSVSIGFHSGVTKAVNVFITTDLNGEPVVKQAGSMRPRQYIDVPLDNPYVIEGKEFYIGYTHRQSTATGTPIGFDGNTAGANECFDMLAVYADGGTPEYAHYGSEYGAVAIRATIDGESYPKSAALVSKVTLPTQAFPGDKFNYEVEVKNMGADPISTVDLTTQVGSAAAETSAQTFTSTIKPGATATLKFTTSSSDDTGSLPVVGSIGKVNGSDNVWGGFATTNYMINSSTMSTRMVVIEEYTGTGCGYCPMGWVALENMREKHPNDYIGIGVHLYNETDPMYVSPYKPWAAANITGAPQATANRMKAYGTFQPSYGNCETVYSEISKEATPVSMRIWAWYADNTKTALNTRVRVTASEDINNLSYALAWVITRDNMGPYGQSNYYSGGSLGTMGGFENMGSKPEIMFNDVARDIVHWNGLQGSVPSSLKRNQPHHYDLTLSTADPASVHGDLNIIALLIDKTRGEIVTAAKCKIDVEPDWSGIADAYAGKTPIDIFAVEGGIAVKGNIDHAAFYSIDGSCVATISAEGAVNLPAGIYIVNATGDGRSTSAKIAVK